LGDELFHQSFQLAKGPRDEQQDTVLCLTDLEQNPSSSGRQRWVGGNTGGGLASLSVIESARIFWLRSGFWLGVWKKHPLTILFVLSGTILLTAAVALLIYFLPG